MPRDFNFSKTSRQLWNVILSHGGVSGCFNVWYRRLQFQQDFAPTLERYS